jgi:hypothetical protein
MHTTWLGNATYTTVQIIGNTRNSPIFKSSFFCPVLPLTSSSERVQRSYFKSDLRTGLWTGLQYQRNLKSRSRIKPWKVKKDLEKKCPRYELPQTIPTYVCIENSIYDMKWGANNLDTFSPNVFFSFRLQDFRFLWSMHRYIKESYPDDVFSSG